jgi:uncharacterized membrane protein
LPSIPQHPPVLDGDALSAAHWIYLLGLAALIATVVAKRNVIALAVTATFVTGTAYGGSVVTGLSAVFNGAIVATRELLPIFIIIALVTAMLGAMRGLGADALMIAGSSATGMSPTWCWRW